MKVSIADTELDFDELTVRRGGETERLTQQTAGILRTLVEAAGSVVTKDMLVDRVWGGRIVTDATLSTAMKEARLAVGDTGKAQRVIRTVHGVGFRLAEAPARTPAPVPSGSRTPKLAVLPFRTIGGGPDDGFLGDGLTDELIFNLSRFRDLAVLARSTTERIAQDGLDAAAMRAAYGVDFVLEGSVRRSGERLRVTVQVSSTESGAILATEQYNRQADVDALFDVQDQIAGLCAGRIASPHGPVARQAEEHLAAAPNTWGMFKLVAEFRRFYRSYDPALHASLREALPAALEDEPGASNGWAAYAVVLLEEHRYHVNERPGVDALSPALATADRAVAADPRNAFAQVALAMCRLYALDIEGFDTAAARALELNPGNADVLSEIGHCYAFLGREDEAIALIDQAIELSPEHPGWYHFARTWRYIRLGHLDAALVEIRKVPVPGFYWYHAHLVWLHAALGDMAAAREEVDTLRQVFPDFEARIYNELVLFRANEDLVASALDHWAKAGLEVRRPDGPVGA